MSDPPPAFLGGQLRRFVGHARRLTAERSEESPAPQLHCLPQSNAGCLRRPAVRSSRRHTAWAGTIIDALEEQSVIVVGTDTAGVVIPHLTWQLISLHTHRADVAEHLEAMVEARPLYPVLTSMPGVAVRTAAIIIAETAGKSERVSHSGNNRLKRALFPSAFASIRFDPTSREYYDRKRAQGKRHNQALIALAHRRLTVLFAMIRDGSLYDVPTLKIT